MMKQDEAGLHVSDLKNNTPDSSPLWVDLNDLRWKLYTGQKANDADLSINVIRPKLKDGCPQALQKAILALLQQRIKKLTVQDRFLWLSSSFLNRIYPPIAVEETGGYTPQISIDQIIPCLNKPKEFDQYDKWEPLSDTPNYKIPNLNLSQHPNIGDCSFVCSLMNLKGTHGYPKVVKSLNAPGSYMVNFHFNGSDHRLICTPDTSKIPTSSINGQLSLRSNDINDKLIELAYLAFKCSSYSHIGSNTAIDTHLLSGYIPELLKIKDMSSWAKLLSYHSSGACTLAFGTKAFFEINTEKFVVNHDYTVSYFSDEQLCLVNPWKPDSPIVVDDWLTMLEYFDVVYVNWITDKLFRDHKKIHFKYNADISNKHVRSTVGNPVFEIKNTSEISESVYLLLEKHKSEQHPYIDISTIDDFISTTNPTKYKNNTGFSLLKIEVPRKGTLNVCCFSELSANYTLNLYSLSPALIFEKADLSSLVTICDTPFAHNYTMDNEKYCQNPTFQLSFDASNAASENRYAECSFQITCKDTNINFQIYNVDDFSLQKPLIPDSQYDFGLQTKHRMHLLTTEKYKIVCSSANAKLNSKFDFSCNNKNVESKLILDRYFSYFGGHYKTCIPLRKYMVNTMEGSTNFKITLLTTMGTMRDVWNVRLYKNVELLQTDVIWSLEVLDADDCSSLVLHQSELDGISNSSVPNIVINKTEENRDTLIILLHVGNTDALLLNNMALEIGSLFKLNM